MSATNASQVDPKTLAFGNKDRTFLKILFTWMGVSVRSVSDRCPIGVRPYLFHLYARQRGACIIGTDEAGKGDPALCDEGVVTTSEAACRAR